MAHFTIGIPLSLHIPLDKRIRLFRHIPNYYVYLLIYIYVYLFYENIKGSSDIFYEYVYVKLCIPIPSVIVDNLTVSNTSLGIHIS